jgi:hypothetical protein
VLWQLIGAGVSMVVAPMAYSLKVCVGVEWGALRKCAASSVLSTPIIMAMMSYSCNTITWWFAQFVTEDVWPEHMHQLQQHAV